MLVQTTISGSPCSMYWKYRLVTSDQTLNACLSVCRTSLCDRWEGKPFTLQVRKLVSHLLPEKEADYYEEMVIVMHFNGSKI